MFASIDPGAPEPLFEQLVSGIRAQVIDGVLAPGERLPAARDLGESLEINVHTVLKAYQLLRDEGFIELRRGRGAVVSSKGHDYDQLQADIAALVADARKLDLTPTALSALIRKAYQ